MAETNYGSHIVFVATGHCPECDDFAVELAPGSVSQNAAGKWEESRTCPEGHVVVGDAWFRVPPAEDTSGGSLP